MKEIRGSFFSHQIEEKNDMYESVMFIDLKKFSFFL
jgi:hypothetical protein